MSNVKSNYQKASRVPRLFQSLVGFAFFVAVFTAPFTLGILIERMWQ